MNNKKIVGLTESKTVIYFLYKTITISSLLCITTVLATNAALASCTSSLPPVTIASDDFSATTWDGVTWGGGTGWNGGWNDRDYGESGGNHGPNLGTDGGEGWNVAIIDCNQTNNHNNCEPLGTPKLSLENNDYISRPIDLSSYSSVDFSFSLETTDKNDAGDVLTVKVCTDATESDCKVIYTSPSGDFAATPINVTATLTDLNYLVSTAELFFFIDSFSGSAEYIYIGAVIVEDSCPSAPPAAFSCDMDAYMTHSVAMSNPSDITSIDIAAATSQLEQANIHPNNINAIGYNVIDGYIWGYDRDTNQVIRIDSNYNVTSYTIPGLPANSFHIGDVSQSGILYLAEKYIEPDKIYRVDVDPSSATYLQQLTTITLSSNTVFTASDFAFHPDDGMLYIPNDDGHLYKINSTTGVITDVGDMQISGYSNANVTFFDRDGYFYINNSNNSTVYRIDLTNPASPDPKGRAFSTIAIPVEADGAHCPNAPIGTNLTIIKKIINDEGGTNTGADFGVTTDAGALVFDGGLLSGDTTTYTANPVNVAAGTFTLTAPGLTGYAQTAIWWTCTTPSGGLVSSNSMNSGTLTGSIAISEGDSVTCTVTYDDSAVCSALTGEVNVAISPISKLKTDNTLFLATSNLSSSDGHIKAYTITSNGLPSGSASWDAASAMATQNQRLARLYSTSSSGGNKVLFNDLQDAAFDNNGIPTNATIKTSVGDATLGAISPDSNIGLLDKKIDVFRYLKDSDYKSFYNSTVSTRSSESNATTPALVLASSDDGFLYAFKQSNGYLEWGWTPRSLVKQFKLAATFKDQHFMQGRIDLLNLKTGSDYATYVVGSYRDGLGQYVLKLNSDSSLNSVVWDTDHKDTNILADQAPNHGKRAYFSDGDGKRYMAYVITNSSDISTLHIRSIADSSLHYQLLLNFKATSTPYVMSKFKGQNAPASNTLYLGDSNGNIHSTPLLITSGTDAGDLNTETTLTDAFANGGSVASLNTSNSSPVLYIGATTSKFGNDIYLRAQSTDRLTLFIYKHTDTSWQRKWTTTIGSAGKWVNGSSTLTADSGITSLPTGANITDEAYVLARSIVLPVTLPPTGSNCFGTAHYYFFRIDDGHIPNKIFYNMSDNSAIGGSIELGSGTATRLQIAQHPKSKKLVGLGLSDQLSDGGTGVNKSFYIEDRISTGVRSWRELF